MGADLVVTVPRGLWLKWLEEGDLPGEPWTEQTSHFWISSIRMPYYATPGSRVYVVAWGRVRGYAPLVQMESRCILRPERGCLVRQGGAVACTIPEEVRGFQNWRYAWFEPSEVVPFPDWQMAGVG